MLIPIRLFEAGEVGMKAGKGMEEWGDDGLIFSV
jgi:hypothetical protein